MLYLVSNSHHQDKKSHSFPSASFFPSQDKKSPSFTSALFFQYQNNKSHPLTPASFFLSFSWRSQSSDLAHRVVSSPAAEHRTIEWLRLEGILNIIQFQPPAKSRFAHHQIRMPWIPSDPASNASRDGGSRIPLGRTSPFQCLATH